MPWVLDYHLANPLAWQSNASDQVLLDGARSLNQDTTDMLLADVDKVWPVVSAKKVVRYPASDTSILRGLLKHMNGSSEDAERLRRYPPTWMVLTSIFDRNTSVSLARFLSDGIFISVLKKSCDDILETRRHRNMEVAAACDLPQGNGPPPAKKQKREDHTISDVHSLRSPESSFRTMQGIFASLEKLPLRKDLQPSTTGSFRKALLAGAVLSKPAKQCRDLVYQLLRLCDWCLTLRDNNLSSGQAAWVDTLIGVWNACEKEDDESLEVASKLYPSMCAILAKLAPDAPATTATGHIWVGRLRRFMRQSLIHPARNVFNSLGTLNLLKTALLSTSSQLPISATTVWTLSVSSREEMDMPRSSKSHESWINSVFALLLDALQGAERQCQNDALVCMLDVAFSSKSVPDANVLCRVCRSQCLYTDRTDWILLGRIMQCNTDVFLLNEDILSSAFDRITGVSITNEPELILVVAQIIVPLMEAFGKARDLQGFVQRWHEHLRKSCQKDGTSLDTTLWFDSTLRHRFSVVVESFLSIKQLLSLLETLLEPKPMMKGPLLVILEAISEGVTQEEYIDAVGLRIAEKAFADGFDIKIASTVLALRWRIVGAAALRLASDNFNDLWSIVKEDLVAILENGMFSGADAIEAFKCCCKLWIANYPGGEHETELYGVIHTAVERMYFGLQGGTDSPSSFDPAHAAWPYLTRLENSPSSIKYSKPFSEILFDLAEHVSPHVGNTTRNDTDPSRSFREMFLSGSLEDEQDLVEMLTEKLLKTLRGPESQGGWAQLEGLFAISALRDIPIETLSRDKRKRAMSSWKLQKSAISTRASSDPGYARAVLRLLGHLMGRSIIYHVSFVNPSYEQKKNG